jgi:hypothetical protein
MKKNVLFIFISVALFSCKSKTSESQTADSTAAIAVDTVATATKPVSAEETLCFEHKEGKDNTTVKLVINGDAVTGEMNWTPYEKDGAVGSLKGKKVRDEIFVDYDYVIEGSNQSEEKIFKIEGDKLLEKSGELIDGKDGKLVMKDPSKATYMDGLVKVKCQ